MDMDLVGGTAGLEEHLDTAVAVRRRLVVVDAVVGRGLESLHRAREVEPGRAGNRLVREDHSRLAAVSIGPGSSLELIQLAAVEDSPAGGSLEAGDSLAVGCSRTAAGGSLGPGRANRTGSADIGCIGCTGYRDRT